MSLTPANVLDLGQYLLDRSPERAYMPPGSSERHTGVRYYRISALLYLAQGWAYAWYDAPLFNAAMQVGANYVAFADLAPYRIDIGYWYLPKQIPGAEAARLSTEQADVLDRMLDFYGKTSDDRWREQLYFAPHVGDIIRDKVYGHIPLSTPTPVDPAVMRAAWINYYATVAARNLAADEFQKRQNEIVHIAFTLPDSGAPLTTGIFKRAQAQAMLTKLRALGFTDLALIDGAPQQNADTRLLASLVRRMPGVFETADVPAPTAAN